LTLFAFIEFFNICLQPTFEEADSEACCKRI